MIDRSPENPGWPVARLVDVRPMFLQTGIQDALRSQIRAAVAPASMLMPAWRASITDQLTASVRDAVTAPMRRATLDLVRATSPTALTPSINATLGVASWKTAVDSQALLGLRSITESLQGYKAMQANVLARDISALYADAFASIPAQRFPELLPAPVLEAPAAEAPAAEAPAAEAPAVEAPADAPVSDELDLEWRIRNDEDLRAAVDEVVDSEPVRRLLREMERREAGQNAERQREQLREQGRAALARRLDGLTTGQITWIFTGLYSLVVASVLEISGNGEFVGAVTDTAGWPLALFGLAAFIDMLRRGRGR